MNKRKLLGLLCLMALLATSCDDKGDYWGAMEASKTKMTLERICDVSTLSQDSVRQLSYDLGMNTEDLYRMDAVIVGKVTNEGGGYYNYYPRFLIAKDKEMKELITEAYVRNSNGNTFYACLDQDLLPPGETYYCAMADYQYDYNGRPGMLDHLLNDGTGRLHMSQAKMFSLSALPRFVVYDYRPLNYSFYLSVEVRSKRETPIIERGACYSSTNELPTVADQKTVAPGTRNYDYSSFDLEVTDLLPNTTYYIRPYATTKEGTGYGPVAKFTTGYGSEPLISNFYLNQYVGGEVELYASFYTNDFQITKHGYSYGIYSRETGTVDHEQTVEVPVSEYYDYQINARVSDLRPGTIYVFRVYAENAVGITYSDYQAIETPTE